MLYINTQRNYIMKEELKYNNKDTFRCPYCNGDCFKEIEHAPGYIRTCPLCDGEGIVDWIKKITGYVKKSHEPSGIWKNKNNGGPFY